MEILRNFPKSKQGLIIIITISICLVCIFLFGFYKLISTRKQDQDPTPKSNVDFSSVADHTDVAESDSVEEDIVSQEENEDPKQGATQIFLNYWDRALLNFAKSKRLNYSREYADGDESHRREDIMVDYENELLERYSIGYFMFVGDSSLRREIQASRDFQSIDLAGDYTKKTQDFPVISEIVNLFDSQVSSFIKRYEGQDELKVSIIESDCALALKCKEIKLDARDIEKGRISEGNAYIKLTLDSVGNILEIVFPKKYAQDIYTFHQISDGFGIDTDIKREKIYLVEKQKYDGIMSSFERLLSQNRIEFFETIFGILPSHNCSSNHSYEGKSYERLAYDYDLRDSKALIYGLNDYFQMEREYEVALTDSTNRLKLYQAIFKELMLLDTDKKLAQVISAEVKEGSEYDDRVFYELAFAYKDDRYRDYRVEHTQGGALRVNPKIVFDKDGNIKELSLNLPHDFNIENYGCPYNVTFASYKDYIGG